MSIENIKKLREMTGAGILDIKKALDKANDDIDLAVKYLRESGILKAAKKMDRIATEGIIDVVKTKNNVVIFEINTETDFVAKNDKFLSFIDELKSVIEKADLIKNIDDILNLEIKNEKIKDIIINLSAIIGEKIILRRVKIFDFNSKENTFAFYIHNNKKIGVTIISDNLKEELLKDIAMHIAAMNPQYLVKEDISQDKISEETEIAKKEMADKIKGKPENIKEAIIKGKVDKILSENVLLEQEFVKVPGSKIKAIIGNGKILNFVRFELGEGIEKKQEDFAQEVQNQIKNSSKNDNKK